MTAGTYNGSVTISSTGAANSPMSVPVTLTVAAAPPPANPNLTANPTSLSFSYTMGGASPAGKTISVGSSGTAISYTVSSSGNWLSASGGGSTPGTVNVSVNPGSMAAGTYNGSVTISSSGAANSPMTVPVTLTVAAAPPPTNPSLTANPGSLSFSYTTGGASPASKTISVGSSGPVINYTLTTSGNWLSATGGGSTPGTVNVSVNPANMTAGTYNGTVTLSSSNASNSPMKIPVTLTVTSSTPQPPSSGGSLVVKPSRLVFYAEGADAPSPQSISVRSNGSAVSFTAEVFGGSWVSVSPSAGSTPGRVNVSAYATGLPAGTYSCIVQIQGGRSTRKVQVVLVVGTSQTSGGGGDDDDEREGAQVRPFTFDPTEQEAVNATWRENAGAMRTSTDPANQGLVLTKRRSGPATAIAGAIITGAAGSQLSRLSFDLRTDSECSAKAPQFLVTTADNVVHTAACANGTARALTATGWKRITFNPADSSQLTPAVKPGVAVKTIALVMDKIAGNGFAVLDNVNLNGTFVGKQ
jgi:hypothetical protein